MRAHVANLLLSVLAVGCSFDFDRSSEVKDRRILAIRGDPAEIAGNVPIPEKLVLRALVADPQQPDAQVDYEWSLCFIAKIADHGRGGENGEGDMEGFGGSSAFKRCDEMESAIVIDSGTKALTQLAVELPLLDLAQKLLGEMSQKSVEPPQIQAQLKVSDLYGPLYAVKKITVTGVLPKGQDPNINPQLGSLQFGQADWPAGLPHSLVYGGCPEDQKKEVEDAAAGKKVKVCSYEITPVFDDAQAEYYQGILGDGTIERRRERLRFSWFSDQGGISRDSTSMIEPGESPDPKGLSTDWREPAARVERARLWVVIRDGRGGVSWEQREIIFE